MWLSRFLVALIVVAFFTQAESQQPAVLADETRSYEISSTAPGQRWPACGTRCPDHGVFLPLVVNVKSLD